MKSRILMMICFSVLTSCAYQRGVLEDKASEKATATSEHATTIEAPNQAPAMTPQSNPAANAHKMIAPLTGG